MKNKVLILSYMPESYANKRLKEEFEKKGFECEVEKPTNFYCYTNDNEKGYDRIYKRSKVKSEKLLAKEYAAVIPRFTDENEFGFGCMTLRHFNENLNVFSTGSVFGIQICVNKFYNAQWLSKLKIPVPKQVLSHRPTDYMELIKLVGDLPAVGKLQQGSQGSGVFILNDKLAASTALRSMEKGGEIVLQKFIDTGEVKNDIRALCIGAETNEPKIFAFKRYALDEDFRSNYSISGLGEKVELTQDEKNMVLKISKSLKLGIVGCDIMRDADNENKPYIVETNHAPGLKGVESITGENIAGAIVDYVASNYKKGGLRNASFSNFEVVDIDNLNEKVSHYLSHQAVIENILSDKHEKNLRKAAKMMNGGSERIRILSIESESGSALIEFNSLYDLFSLGYYVGLESK